MKVLAKRGRIEYGVDSQGYWIRVGNRVSESTLGAFVRAGVDVGIDLDEKVAESERRCGRRGSGLRYEQRLRKKAGLANPPGRPPKEVDQVWLRAAAEYVRGLNGKEAAQALGLTYKVWQRLRRHIRD